MIESRNKVSIYSKIKKKCVADFFCIKKSISLFVTCSDRFSIDCSLIQILVIFQHATYSQNLIFEKYCCNKKNSSFIIIIKPVFKIIYSQLSYNLIMKISPKIKISLRFILKMGVSLLKFFCIFYFSQMLVVTNTFFLIAVFISVNKLLGLTYDNSVGSCQSQANPSNLKINNYYKLQPLEMTTDTLQYMFTSKGR